MRKVIDWELGKKLKFDHTNKWYVRNPKSVLENDTHKLLWDFEIQTDHQISARRPDLIVINKQKTYRIVDFAVLADHRVKLQECEKRDRYLDLARELKKLWNMKMTIIPVVICALSAITKGLVQGLEDFEITGWVETTKKLYYWELLEYLQESWKLEETCCHSTSREKPSAYVGEKNTQKWTNNNKV